MPYLRQTIPFSSVVNKISNLHRYYARASFNLECVKTTFNGPEGHFIGKKFVLTLQKNEFVIFNEMWFHFEMK